MSELPIVASWVALKIGSIQIVHRGPRGEAIEQPCRIVARCSKLHYLAQWSEPVKIGGRFFYQVETD